MLRTLVQAAFGFCFKTFKRRGFIDSPEPDTPKERPGFYTEPLLFCLTVICPALLTKQQHRYQRRNARRTQHTIHLLKRLRFRVPFVSDGAMACTIRAGIWGFHGSGLLSGLKESIITINFVLYILSFFHNHFHGVVPYDS